MDESQPLKLTPKRPPDPADPGEDDSQTEPNPADAKQRRLEKLRRVQRATILEAAEKVFGAQGFHVAKMTDIAAEAGFSTGSLYNYFSGKEEIFITLLSQRLDELWDELDAELSQPGDFLDLIQRLTSVYSRYMDKRRSFFQILHRALPALVLGPVTADAAIPLADIKSDVYQQFTVLVERVLGRGVDEGVLREMDPKPLAVMLIGMMDSVQQLWLSEEPPRPFAETLPNVLDVFLNGVRK